MAVVWKLFDGTNTIDFTSATGFRGERGHVTQITNIPGDGSIPEYVTEAIPVTIVGTTDDNFAAYLQTFALLQKGAAEYWVDPQQATPVWYHEKLSAETGERRALVKSLGLAFDQETGSLMSGSPKTTAGKKATLFVERHPYWERTTARIFPNTTPTAAAAVTYDYTDYGPQLLLNNSFETAGDGGADIWANWTESAGDGALANEVVIIHDGADACKTTAGASNNTFVSQAIAVIPNQIYNLYFWTRGDGTNDGKFGIYDNTNGAWILDPTLTGITAAAYAPYSYNFTTPSGCVLASIYFWCPTTNGGVAYFDLAYVRLETHDIVGDVPARINGLAIRKGDAGAGVYIYRVWMGIRSANKHGAAGVTSFVPIWECEDGTFGGDVSEDAASDQNGASPGSGSGSFLLVDEDGGNTSWDDGDFHTAVYLSLSQVGYTTASDAYGRFMWLLRAKVSAGTWQVRMRTGYNTARNYFDPVEISGTSWDYLYLGICTVPPRNVQAIDTAAMAVAGDINTNVWLEAKVTSGAGDLSLDCICTIPIDEGFLHIWDGMVDTSIDLTFGQGPMGSTQVIDVAGGPAAADVSPFEAEGFCVPPGDGRIIAVYARETTSDLTDQIEFADPTNIASAYTERWTGLRGAE